MTAFYNVSPHGDIDDLIFDELDYEIRPQIVVRTNSNGTRCVPFCLFTDGFFSGIIP